METLANKAAPTVHITAQKELFNCEYCGSYYSGTLRIDLPDGRMLKATHDGHFGHGAWNGELAVAYFWSLQALGIDLVVNGELVEDDTYRVCTQVSPNEVWQEVNLSPAQRETVQIDRVMRPNPNFPDYPYPVSISWIKRNGEKETLAVNEDSSGSPDAWDGDISSLYLRVLQDRVNVIVQE